MNNIKKLSFIGKLFIWILLIVIVEGAIRKWIIPSSTIPLMLMRDLLVFIGIIYGIQKLYLKFNKLPEVLLLLWTVIVVIWGLAQFLFDLIPLPVVFIGLRSWILYAWFSLLCFRGLTYYDVSFIIKILLISLIPMAILAIVQFLSPISSWINKQPGGDDDAFIFVVVKDIVRTTGTFSFTIGYTTYVTLLSPLVLFLLSNRKKFFNSNLISFSIIILFFIASFISGSRSVIFFVFSILLVYIFAIFISKKIFKISAKSIFLSSIFIIISVYISYPILQRAYLANTSRIESASHHENVSQRIINTFIGEDKTWENLTILGQGIGAGSNAARVFMPKGDSDFILGEMEVDRILNEAGILGVFFLILKFGIPLLMILSSFKIMVKNSNILPFLFSYYLLVQLLTTTLTGQITVHAFMFLALGLGSSFFKYYKILK